MNNLLQFLTTLAVTPQEQERFVHIPPAVFSVEGVTESEPTTLGNWATVTTTFSSELQARDLTAVMGAACFSDPGPDPEPNPDPGPDDEPTQEALSAMFA